MTFYASVPCSSLLHLRNYPSYHLSIASLCSLRLRSSDHLSLKDKTEERGIERGRERRWVQPFFFSPFMFSNEKHVNIDTSNSIGREPTLSPFSKKHAYTHRLPGAFKFYAQLCTACLYRSTSACKNTQKYTLIVCSALSHTLTVHTPEPSTLIIIRGVMHGANTL